MLCNCFIPNFIDIYCSFLQWFHIPGVWCMTFTWKGSYIENTIDIASLSFTFSWSSGNYCQKHENVKLKSFNKLVYLFFLQSVMILLFFYIKHYLVVILFLRKLFIYTYSQYQDMLIHISLDVMTIWQGIFKICTKRNHYILSYIKNG